MAISNELWVRRLDRGALALWGFAILIASLHVLAIFASTTLGVDPFGHFWVFMRWALGVDRNFDLSSYPAMQNLSLLAMPAILRCALSRYRAVGSEGALLAVAAMSLPLGLALSYRFAPCGDEDLWFDHDTRAWPVVVDDLKRWFALKEQACAAGGYRPLDQTMDLIRWRVGDRAVMLIHANATSVTLRIQRTAALAPSSANVVIDGVSRTVPLRGEVDTVTLPLPQSWRVSLRAAHRLDLRMAGDPQGSVTTVLGWPTVAQ